MQKPPETDSDDEFEMDNSAKLKYLIDQGFPDHDRIKEVLIGTDWNLNDAYFILIEDLVEQEVRFN